MEDREPRPHKVVSKLQVYRQVRIYPRLVVFLFVTYIKKIVPQNICVRHFFSYPITRCAIAIFKILVCFIKRLFLVCHRVR